MSKKIKSSEFIIILTAISHAFILSVIMLSFVVFSIIMVHFTMLRVSILFVFRLNVVALFQQKFCASFIKLESKIILPSNPLIFWKQMIWSVWQNKWILEAQLFPIKASCKPKTKIAPKWCRNTQHNNTKQCRNTAYQNLA